MINYAAYWIALAHLPRWGYGKINNLIIRFFHDNNISIEDFFNLRESEWIDKYQLIPKEVEDLKFAKSELSNNSFLAESLLNQGYEIIPITSPEYSKILKENLKVQYSPAVLYVKGNKQIMSEKSVAIVGSRNASDISLQFTDNIAKLASQEYKVIVSGFAKGVDKQALDSAIKYKGQSIIVLPQGIMTFGSGFKTYYRQIVDGDVLVLSTFHPKAPWKAELAMARNPIIYGLASEIFVAESSEKGGTWSGVTDGLRKKRTIYVRFPEKAEHNANLQLIQKGAFAVDFNGNKIESEHYHEIVPKETGLVNDPDKNLDYKIKALLGNKSLTTKEINEKLKTDWTQSKLTSYLKKLDFVEVIKAGKTNLFKLRGSSGNKELTLF
jgi:DNA processing protein